MTLTKAKPGPVFVLPRKARDTTPGRCSTRPLPSLGLPELAVETISVGIWVEAKTGPTFSDGQKRPLGIPEMTKIQGQRALWQVANPPKP